METRYILTSDGELYHASTKNGEERANHKYISREWKNGRWVYTYSYDSGSERPKGQNYSVIDSNKKAMDSSPYPIGQNYSVMDPNKKFVDYNSEYARANREQQRLVNAKEKEDRERLERYIQVAKTWLAKAFRI